MRAQPLSLTITRCALARRATWRRSSRPNGTYSCKPLGLAHLRRSNACTRRRGRGAVTINLLAQLLMAIRTVVRKVRPSEGGMDTSIRSANLVSLRGSVGPLEKHFNEHGDARRF